MRPKALLSILPLLLLFACEPHQQPEEKPITVEKVSLDRSSAVLKTGQGLWLEATVVPDYATDNSVTWISSNSAVATVNNKGYVSAVSEGTATITAKSGEKTATCEITVSDSMDGGHENTVTEPFE